MSLCVSEGTTVDKKPARERERRQQNLLRECETKFDTIVQNANKLLKLKMGLRPFNLPYSD